MRTTLSFALLGAAASVVSALGQKPVVAFNGTSDDFQIAGGSISTGQILVSATESWGVIRTAHDLAVDFGRVTGSNYTISTGKTGATPASYDYLPVNNKNNTVYSTLPQQSFPGPAYADPALSSVVVIAGTIGQSDLIDSLIASGTIDVSMINGTWEAFTSQLVKNPIDGVSQALVIAGSDARGTIYGLYDVSEQIGVSPWYFFADSPAKKSANIYVPAGLTKVQASPSVKFRGIFLNDEQPGLTNWVATNFADAANGAAGYGPDFYAHVFELLLRLRANYLWPAIWGSMLEVDFVQTQPLADAFEIVLGSSHTEPLMRAQNEFGQFYSGPWAYNLNNATIDNYFRYGVQRAKPYWKNSLWTMGMRGTGDTAIEGLGPQAIVNMLDTLVNNQQRIISEGLGVDISEVAQMWCLYKEVQSYIFEGLQVPEDVTLLWADDNWGNVRRFPLKNETDRVGGAGVYYHFDYVGDPRDYKWINTVQLQKTAEQLHTAYARGADRIWIVNVGDLKPLEIPISHLLDMAYDAELYGVDSTADWAAAWATREFGSSLSSSIADLMTQYAVLANRRKYELIEPQSFSVLNYNEADAILTQWGALATKAQAISATLDASVQPIFFQTVLHPILAGQIVTSIYVGGAKNALYAGQNRNSANDVMSHTIGLSTADYNLTAMWDSMLDGKWAHMLDQTHVGYKGYWQQPMRNTLPALTYVQTQRVSLAGHVGLGVEASNASVQGDDIWHSNSGNTLAVPQLDTYGPITRYIDVFSRGTKSCEWTATPAASYVKLSQTSGTIAPGLPDTRVYVSVDWANAPSAPNMTTVTINFNNTCRGLDKYAYPLPTVTVPVYNRAVSSTFPKGFVESDGHVSVNGPSYQSIIDPASGKSNITYHTFAGLSRTGDAVGLVPQNTDKLAPADAPALEYDLYLFTNTSKANVTVYMNPSHNYLGDATPLSYAISLYPSGATTPPAPTIVTPIGPSVGANLPAGWGFAVANAAWGGFGNYTTSTFAVPTPGAYTLRIWALMPSVIIQKVVVDLGGVRPSYLGPPESFYVGRDVVGQYNGTSFLNDVGTLGGVSGAEPSKCKRSVRV